MRGADSTRAYTAAERPADAYAYLSDFELMLAANGASLEARRCEHADPERSALLLAEARRMATCLRRRDALRRSIAKLAEARFPR